MRYAGSAAAFLAFILAGQAAASPAVAADQSIVAAAQREGELDWYTTLIVNQAVLPIAKAFEKKYPKIKVAFSRDDDLQTGLKVFNELRSGRPHADVFDGLDNMIPLQRAGYLASYSPPNAADYPKQLRDKDGQWIAYDIYVFTPAVNQDMVPLAQAPHSYQDLLNPRWKGKMAWNPNSVAGGLGFIGAILGSMGHDRGMDYLKKLSAQQIVSVPASSRAILDQVIAGEYPLALMTFDNHSVISARSGAPSRWLKVSPAPIAFNAIALLKTAPHPNAAKLFIDFITSPEGQKVISDADYLPALPTAPASVPGLRPSDGGFAGQYLEPSDVVDHLPEWKQIFDNLFR
jgi:ABC-type Fe3+ transport system substrate-binding protein